MTDKSTDFRTLGGLKEKWRDMGDNTHAPVVAVSAGGGPQSSAIATIANGASLSNAIDCGNARAALLIMPAGWTAAGLTSEVSYDGAEFAQMYDIYGSPYPIQAGASRVIQLPLADWLGIRHFKLRSVTAGTATPVAQGAERAIIVVLVP